jgi:hypothetical protein
MSIEEYERLSAIEAIQQLKARYFRCMDQRDWSGYGETFLPDGVLEVESLRRAEDGAAAISRREQGREAIVAWVSGVLDGATTIHHGHMPEIIILTADSASGIWAMEDRVIWPERSLHGWGHYHERYRLVDGRWHIAASRLTRLRVELSPAAAPADPDRPMMLDAAS